MFCKHCKRLVELDPTSGRLVDGTRVSPWVCEQAPDGQWLHKRLVGVMERDRVENIEMDLYLGVCGF